MGILSEAVLSSSPLRHPDPEAHEVGCLDFDPAAACSDPGRTHVDVFCNCHRFTDPKILPNGTDIAWPAGWDEKQAAEWRVRNNLAPPSEPGISSGRPGWIQRPIR
jgi:hypothetical protein